MMNRFWKKQLPAALLTLVLMISLVPAAMAEGTCPNAANGAHSWTAWTTITSPTCTTAGASQRNCQSCPAVETNTIPALGHDFSGSGTVTASPTCTAAGTMLIKCSHCDATTSRTVPALGHSYVNGVCSVCGDKTSTVTPGPTKNFSLTVEPSDEAAVGRTIRSNIGAFETIEFSNISGTSYGKLYATSSKAALSTSKTYSYADISKLYFIASAREGSYSVNYTATLSDKSTLSGKITIRVAVPALKDGVITYKVQPGESVNFNVDDFVALYEEELDGTVRYATLSTSATLRTTSGTVYYNYGEKDEEAFSKSTLSDYYYYFSNDRYGEYPLSNLSFVVPKNAKEQTFTFTCKVYDSNRESVTGTLKIVIGKTSSIKDGVITYNVKAGESVDFNSADFEAIYEDELDGNVRYITLSTTSSISAANGTVYYNHGANDEEVFTKSTLSDYYYYFTKASYGDYPIDKLSFVAPKNAKNQTITLSCKIFDSDKKSVSGTVKIVIGGGSSSDANEIVYSVKPGNSVDFKLSDFREIYEDELDADILYVTFSTSSALSTANGTVYCNYGEKDEEAFTRNTLDNYKFYYSKAVNGDYALKDLSFVAPKGAKEQTISLTCQIFDDDGLCVLCTVKIEVSNLVQPTETGDITYHMEKNDTYTFSRNDFNEFFHQKYSNYDIKYITFETDDTLTKNTGLLYYDYDGEDEESFDENDLNDELEFYYSASKGDYAINKLTFVTGKSFNDPITLTFTAYYTSTKSVTGTLVITSEEAVTAVEGDIIYLTAYNSNLQLNANDFSRFLKKKYPTSTLQSVTLNDVPSLGSLYYNCYGTSAYGTSKLLLNSSNCKSLDLYFSPSSASQYSLSELTYIPKGTNYCVSIPFTAYGSGSKHVDGTVLISVSLTTVPDVYSVTQKNTAISLPASNIAASVLVSTGMNPAAIQFVKLPDASAGTLYVGTGTSHKASLTEFYGNTAGTYKMSQLRFVPASNFTGSVELPYVALNSSGTPIAAGKYCLGVLGTQKSFTDIPASTWCYKYVTELSSAGIIDGYADKTFKEKSTITYGAALKLVMLAAGYPEQAPINSNVFSGYLAKAQADGLITKKNVNLAGPITRLQIAQLAAAALKLDTTNLSAVQPFTDTTDASVRALNAAGIIEGYFANGTSTFKPNNTLTRGHVSAIVWRMRNLNK